MKTTILDSIVYEVLLSFSLYKRRTHLKYLNISKNWHEETRNKISPELDSKMAALEDLQFEDLSVHLIERCPAKDFEGYISWLSKLAIGDLFEIISPYITDSRTLPADLENRRQIHISLLSEWYEEYFKDLEGDLAPILAVNCERADDANLEMDPFPVIEELTKGFSIESLALKEAVLVPVWHFRPLSLIDIHNEKAFLSYPCSLTNREEALLITKALSEKKRLMLLELIQTKPKTFTELVHEMGMTKGNIHHHLLLLRSAGLLKITPTAQDYFLYSSRPDRIKDLYRLLLEE